MAAALPWSWRVSLYALFLMVPYTLCYCIVTRKWVNASLTVPWRVTFLLLAVFSLVYVASVSYSADVAEGWRNATAKLTLALVAIVVLLIPKSLYTSKSANAIMQLFTLSLAVRFVVRLVITLYDLFFGCRPHDELMGSYFDPMHHTYISMYLLLAISYIGLLLLRSGRAVQQRGSESAVSLTAMRKASIVALGILLIVYLVVLQSRAAVLTLLVLAVVAWCHLCFVQKRVKLSLLLLLAAAAGSALLILAIPGPQKRLVSTAMAAVSGHYQDDRYYTTKATIAVIADNMPLGVGAGDREAQLMQQYEQIGADKALAHSYNSHNQYLDTLMAVGIVGLLVLIALFAVPFVAALKSRHYLLLALIAIVAFNALFESLFERQMGLLFYSLFCALLAQVPQPRNTVTA